MRTSDKGKGYADGLSQMKINTEGINVGCKETLKSWYQSQQGLDQLLVLKRIIKILVAIPFLCCIPQGVNDESGTAIEGSLNLCDLSGRERLDRSGVASYPKRLKKKQTINKSLMCLGDTLNALANHSYHMPCRNSKLTCLLQDCLSGDGKAIAHMNLSPALESSNETLCSLRFA